MSRLDYRSDIDGLRGIAVLAVMWFHAFPSSMSGGYVGVDVFFVISGFLITNIIMREQAEGKFTIANFYRRRIRRIFPALSLVLFSVFALAWYAGLPSEFLRVAHETWPSAFFGANFFFAQDGGYFNGSVIVKPLIHLWSLGIEEQFYLFFPLGLILFRKVRRGPQIFILAALGASMWLNVTGIVVDRERTFYWPHTRLWELLIGAALACVQLEREQASPSKPTTFAALISAQRLANTASVAGMCLIFRAALHFDSTNTLFPGWAALMPCAGAALVIAAGPRSWINKSVLSNPLLVGVGLISYPLYLWHWPLLSYAYILNDGYRELVKMPLLGVAFVLSILTYFLLEKPIQKSRSRWLVPALVCAITSIGLVSWRFSSSSGLRYRPHMEKYDRQFREFEWILTAGPSGVPECSNKFPIKDGGYCLIAHADKAPTVALIGDSHAHHFYPGLTKHYEGTSENLILLGGSGCVPFYDVESHMKIDPDKCRPIINQIYDLLQKTPSIKTVILASRGSGYVLGTKSSEMDSWDRHIALAGHANLSYPEVFRQGFRDSISRLQGWGKKVGFIYDVPELALDPRECVHMRPIEFYRKQLTDPCGIEIEKYRERNKVYYSVVGSVAKEFPKVTMFNPADYLCDDTRCWGMIGGNLLYRDDNHLSVTGSLYLSDKYKF